MTAVAALPLGKPVWRRTRLWLGLLVVVVLGAVLVGLLTERPGTALDPASTHPNGSRALVRVLAKYGVDVSVTSSLATARTAGGAVLVAAPDDYSDDQLRTLAASARRLVLVQPGTAASAATVSGLSPDPERDVDTDPGCGLASARAAGPLRVPGDALAYVGAGTACYHGLVVVAGRVVVLGSSALLQNDHLAGDGVAALDVNLISSDRAIRTVTWLRPGGDATGSGPASVWDLFPDGAYRVFAWLIVVGVLVAVWRARRLGGVVSEPLPVVVRSAEVVEGHGRLYARAGARDRAAYILRQAARARIATRLSLPRTASADELVAAAAPVAGWVPAQAAWLLDGAPPGDDAALVRLAEELDRFEAALGRTLDEGKLRE